MVVVDRDGKVVSLVVVGAVVVLQAGVEADIKGEEKAIGGGVRGGRGKWIGPRGSRMGIKAEID